MREVEKNHAIKSNRLILSIYIHTQSHTIRQMSGIFFHKDRQRARHDRRVDRQKLLFHKNWITMFICSIFVIRWSRMPVDKNLVWVVLNV